MSNGMTIINLRCNYLVDPLAIDVPAPRLSWEISGGAKGSDVTAFWVQAASTCELLQQGAPDLWDTGLSVELCKQRINYGGKELPAFARCFWRVGGQDSTGAINWSAPAIFVAGMQKKENWQGQWISYYVEAVPNPPHFRKEFTIAKPVARAVLYATSQGIYQAELNGRPVSRDVFGPGWTDYKKRIYYNTYDVTALLRQTENALGIIVGDGWFRGGIGFEGKRNIYGARIKALANLRIEYVDGSIEVIATDESWHARLGGILQSGFLPGEEYDSRLALKGWSSVGGGGEGWLKVTTAPVVGEMYWDADSASMKERDIALQPYPCEPVRRTQELPARDIWESRPGSQVYDFGQNFAGRVRLCITGRAGQVLRLRFGEMVNPDRTLYVENLRMASSIDTCVLRGGEEIWEPSFTFHGFRYAEITGLEPGQTAELVGVVLGSDTRRVGEFSCSDDMINQLYSNIVWTQRANFLEVPTDCPQRDERLGWTGDAQVFIRTAAYNMDVAAFFRKWLVDLEDTQEEDGGLANVAPKAFLTWKADAAWADAAIICPWWVYQIYGDEEVLRKHYGMMTGWHKYLTDTSKEHLRGTWTFCFGDWLSVNAETPKEIIQSAMYAYVTELMEKIARILGHEEDACRYGALWQKIRAAFIKAYVSADGVVQGDTQTAYVLALKMRLLPEEMRAQAGERLVADIRKNDMHLTTGFVGTPYLLHVLSDIGRDDVAYQLLFNDTYPSWGYSIRNGATTVWERWNGWKKEEGCGDANMNSFSHYAYGSVGEWMFAKVAGIDLLEPGYRRFRIAPRPSDRLSWVKTSHQCMYGRIISEWEQQGGRFSLKAVAPAGTTMEVRLPLQAGAKVSMDGQPLLENQSVKILDRSADFITVALKCGEYLFAVE